MTKRILIFVALFSLLSLNLFAYSLQGSLMEALITNNQTRVLNVIKNKPDLTYFDKAEIYKLAIKENWQENTINQLLLSYVCPAPKAELDSLTSYAKQKDYEKLLKVLSWFKGESQPFNKKGPYEIDVDTTISNLSAFHKSGLKEFDPFTEVAINLPAEAILGMQIEFEGLKVLISSTVTDNPEHDSQVGDIVFYNPLEGIMTVVLSNTESQVLFSQDFSEMKLGPFLVFKASK